MESEHEQDPKTGPLLLPRPLPIWPAIAVLGGLLLLRPMCARSTPAPTTPTPTPEATQERAPTLTPAPALFRPALSLREENVLPRQDTHVPQLHSQ